MELPRNIWSGRLPCQFLGVTVEKDDMNKVVKIDVEVIVEKLLEDEVDIVVIVDVKEVDRLNDVNEISVAVLGI